MKPHKWAKEIKAWADGAEIETQLPNGQWEVVHDPHHLFDNHYEYRIKPQPKVNEFAHIPYWLCCGSLHTHHHYSSCSEANSGNPERCRFGTFEEHQKRMEKPQQQGCDKQTCSALKEPQYVYVWLNKKEDTLEIDSTPCGAVKEDKSFKYIGKIKLYDEASSSERK
jgi:hypothetical protein